MQVVGKRLFCAHLAAQYQGVDEEADQRLDFRAIAIGDRVTDADIGLIAQAEQQRIESTDQRREQGRVVTLAELLELCAQLGGKAEMDTVAAVVESRRARAVGRQFEDARGILELGFPVVQLWLQHLALQPFPLPDGVVGVVHLKCLQGRRDGVHFGVVEAAQLLQQHRHGPTIGHDMVQGQQQNVLVGRYVDGRGANQRRAAQIEGFGRLFIHEVLQRDVLFEECRQLDRLDLQGRLAGDHLYGQVVIHGESGAQRFMPLDDGVEAALQDIEP